MSPASAALIKFNVIACLVRVGKGVDVVVGATVIVGASNVGFAGTVEMVEAVACGWTGDALAQPARQSNEIMSRETIRGGLILSTVEGLSG